MSMADLNLSALVKEHAEFLVDAGFRLASDSAREVRYESDRVFVRVFVTTDDGYLGCRVGLVSRPKDALTEAELLTLAGQPLPGLFPADSESLRADVPELMRRLKTYGREALAGEDSPYKAATALRRQHTERYTR